MCSIRGVVLCGESSSVGCELFSVECELFSVEGELFSVECGMFSVLYEGLLPRVAVWGVVAPCRCVRA